MVRPGADDREGDFAVAAAAVVLAVVAAAGAVFVSASNVFVPGVKSTMTVSGCAGSNGINGARYAGIRTGTRANGSGAMDAEGNIRLPVEAEVARPEEPVRKLPPLTAAGADVAVAAAFGAKKDPLMDPLRCC